MLGDIVYPDSKRLLSSLHGVSSRKSSGKKDSRNCSTASLPRHNYKSSRKIYKLDKKTVHMFSGKMLNWAGLLKLAGGGLKGTSFPPSDRQTCI